MSRTDEHVHQGQGPGSTLTNWDNFELGEDADPEGQATRDVTNFSPPGETKDGRGRHASMIMPDRYF